MRKLFLLPFLLMASLAPAQELSVEQLVDKAIAHAGGWDAWMATKSIQFRKTIVRFEPDGKVKETRVQYH
ncbi:MAG: hypothetical protein M3Z22_05035, partial [Verrucomicrobiota bacterium]|nr:hypothetical protein [Verrucomicrobiota bacterium]